MKKDYKPRDLETKLAEALRELANERARDIHSCGPDCTRPGCVNRRLREQLAGTKAHAAALELEVVRLREALNSYKAIIYDMFPSAILKPLPYDLSSTPFSQTALSELIEKVEKATIERCAELFPQPYADYFGRESQDAIRALPTGQIDVEGLINALANAPASAGD